MPSHPYSLQLNSTAIHHCGSSTSFAFVDTSDSDASFSAVTIVTTTASPMSCRFSKALSTMPSTHRRKRTPQERSKSMSAANTTHIHAALLNQAVTAASAFPSTTDCVTQTPTCTSSRPASQARLQVATSLAFAPTLSKFIPPVGLDLALMQESGSLPSYDSSSTELPSPGDPKHDNSICTP